MFIDARSVDPDKVLEAELCVVGGGAAGITLARECINSAFRVILLESGGLKYDKETQLLAAGEVSGHDYYPLVTARLRLLGGSTNHWNGFCLPLDASDFTEREWVKDSGWPFDRSHLEPFYERAQPICKLGPYRYEYLDWKAEEKKHGQTPFPMAAHRFITTVGQSSHVGAEAINAFASVGREAAKFGEVYRQELEHAPTIRTYLYANVVEIETNESASEVSRVRVACLNGNRFWVKAKLFVLATCAIQNARLLLLSNSRQQTGLGNQHDLVGRYFMEHPSISGAGRLMVSDPSLSRGIYERHLRQGTRLTCLITPAPAAQRKDKLLNCSIRLHPDPEDLVAIRAFKRIAHRLRGNDVPGDLSKDLINVVADMDGVARHIYRRTWHKASEFETLERYKLTYSAEQAPNPSSRVSLSDEKDAMGQPRAKLEWRLTESDLGNARVVLQNLGEELGRISVGRVKVELADENETLSKSFAGSWHHMGTTRMSADPKKGVVDKNCRVHGIGNLFIASSSTFPTSGHANPTLTIVALTVRLADHLKELL